MEHSIQIASCAWGAPFEEFCADVARAGYAGRESELRALLDRHGLSIAACSAGGLFLDPATRDAEIAAVAETTRRGGSPAWTT
jgi:sugar phosphate isomerase/epimerase